MKTSEHFLVIFKLEEERNNIDRVIELRALKRKAKLTSRRFYFFEPVTLKSAPTQKHYTHVTHKQLSKSRQNIVHPNRCVAREQASEW